MKKTAFYLIALATLSIAAVSCTKDEAAKGPQFRISMESASSKTHFNGTNLYWTNGDQFAVYDATNSRALYSAAAEGDQALTATLNIMDGTIDDGPYTAIYPNSIATANPSVVTLPAEQASVAGELTGFPMMAVSDNEELSFKNPCAILKIHMQKSNISISKIQIATDQYINGDFTIDYNDGEPTLTRTNSTNHTKVTTLTMANPVSITEGADFCLYLPAAQYGYFLLKIYDADGNILSKSFSGLNFGRNQYRTLNIPESAINFHPGDLTGEFTVNANGAKVTFSRGNLYKNSNQYHFASKQYLRTESNGDQDHLFTWTSSMQTSYPPQNGGNQSWRVLSKDEWQYMMKTIGGRTVSFITPSHTYTYHFLAAKVTKENGYNVNGYILFPDVFYWPLEESKLPVANKFGSQTLQWSNVPVFTNYEWQMLEAAGSVFLPTTGKIELGNAREFTSGSYYWTSTGNTSDGAYSIRFRDGANSPYYQEGRTDQWKCAIRFVKNVQ